MAPAVVTRNVLTVVPTKKAYMAYLICAVSQLHCSLGAPGTTAGACIGGSAITDYVADLQAMLSSPKAVLSDVNAPVEFGVVVQGVRCSGSPQEYGTMSAIVVQPISTEDIIMTVQYAVAHDLPLGVKGGGHSFQSSFLTKGGITLDLSKMKGITVDAQQRTVTVQGGVVYADIQAATQPYNLAVPWGDATSTGLGLALGGGIGYLSRAFGLTADHIISAKVVLANGTLAVASEKQNAHLLRCMRGAGVVFGVTTELTLQLVDVANLYGGFVAAFDDAEGTNFRAAHEWAAEAMALEPRLGVEIFGKSNILGMGSPGIQVLVALPGDDGLDRQSVGALVQPLSNLTTIIKDTLGELDWYQLMDVVGDNNKGLPYHAAYGISGIATFEQASRGLWQDLWELTTQLPTDVKATYLSDFLGSTVTDNAVKNTTSFTPFAGEIDFHFFVYYSWVPGINNTENSDFAEQGRLGFADRVISTQPYANLATILNDEHLEVQVGGQEHLSDLRALKSELDPANLFNRHQLVGLVTNAA